jgi:hypothetical protein
LPVPTMTPLIISSKPAHEMRPLRAFRSVDTTLLVSFLHSQLMLVKLQRNTYCRNLDQL